jgi:hypothetical protein
MLKKTPNTRAVVTVMPADFISACVGDVPQAEAHRSQLLAHLHGRFYVVAAERWTPQFSRL